MRFGAGRGMGLDIARYALATGHAVVATGRDSAAVDRFGRIDVLVNDAVRLYAGDFEELTPDQVERQLTTSLIGPMADNPRLLKEHGKCRSLIDLASLK